MIQRSSWKQMQQAQHQGGIIEIPTAIAIAAAVVAAGVGIYSAVSAASAQADMADAQAKALEQQAKSQEEAAAYEERQFRRKAALLIGKQHAIYGASGLDTVTGSPLLMELDTVRQAELEAQNIKRGGDVAAASSRFESGLAKYRSNYYQGTIAPSVIGGLAQGTGSVLSSWMGASGGRRISGGARGGSGSYG